MKNLPPHSHLAAPPLPLLAAVEHGEIVPIPGEIRGRAYHHNEWHYDVLSTPLGKERIFLDVPAKFVTLN